MVERCGDRQRKFNGLESWPFRLFIESLPVMLQIALLLLACALSRYMWSINASVASVIISFTVLGMAFYFGIVAAGTSSYECPFQTPASRALRYLRDNVTTWNPLASLGLSVSAITLTTLPVSPITFASLTLPNTISLTYAVLVDARLGLVSASHRVRDIIRSPLSWEISTSRIISGIYSATTKVGYYTVIFLLRADRAFGNAKHKLVQGVRRFRRPAVLPVTTGDVQHQLPRRQNSTGLRITVRNVETLRKQNMDNAHCVCWILRNITDPEAIDSAIHLAGAIQWFDGDADVDPPFDFIVSTFEACFDSTKKLYSGMRNRAYFSARAILKINAGARLRSRKHTSSYPIPAVPSGLSERTDPDLHHILHMLECNSSHDRPTLDFPRVGTSSHVHSLWVSNLFVDLTRVGPNPILKSYRPYLSAAFSDHQAVIANILLVWYLLLGGHVGEETFWAIDKSYAVIPLSFLPFSPLKTVTSDALEGILSCLSIRMMDVIVDRECLGYLEPLLEFLAAWEKRPVHLTQMAYQWCSAISEAAGTLRKTEVSIPRDPSHHFQRVQRFRGEHRYHRRLMRRQYLVPNYSVSPTESGFSEAGPGCDPLRPGGTSDQPRTHPHYLVTADYVAILSVALEVGFRFAAPGHHHLNHTPHHDWVFETAFSSNDDEVVADAVCALIADVDRTPPGSYVLYAAKRIERATPFSPRLRRVSISAVAFDWRRELKASPLGTIQLLNHLNVGVDDMKKKLDWAKALVGAICSPTGLKNLSAQYWPVLGRLLSLNASHGLRGVDPESFDAVTKSLEEAEDWEKLEVWMSMKWPSLRSSESVEDVERTTLKLLLRRPSALPRFTDLVEYGEPWIYRGAELQRICDQARTERPLPESPP